MALLPCHRHHRKFLGFVLTLLMTCPALVFAANVDLDEPSCMLACKSNERCEVQRDNNRDAPQLTGERFTPAGACNTMKVVGAELVLRYRHKGKWFEPPMALTSQKHLKTVFDQFRADVCGVPTRACLQKRMAEKSSTPAGHGADSLATNPAGVGEPCIHGLPCGTVLEPKPQWRFRLTDPTASGEWRAWYLRGKPPLGMPPTATAAVVQGEVVADGAYFQPGAVIAYQLTNAAGTVLASGEFEVLGKARMERLKMLAGSRSERLGLSEEAAWLDTLAASELDWDLQQRLLDK